MDYAELSERLRALLLPHHHYSHLDTTLAARWLADGWDAERLILPAITAIVAQKIVAGQRVPTTLKYYDVALRRLAPAVAPTQESPKAVDLRLAKVYRWKIKMGFDAHSHPNPADLLYKLTQRYGEEFGLEG